MLWYIGYHNVFFILTLALFEFTTNAHYTLDDAFAGIDPINSSNTCDGECVQYYLCSDNKLITDRFIDIRFNEENESKCPHYLHECCEHDKVLDEPPPDVIKPPGVNRELGRPTCGLRNEEGVAFRITGGNDGESEYGEFPWMVAILIEALFAGDNVISYQCGGSLLAPNIVLTAAHCVFDKQTDQLIVRAGEWDTQTENEIFEHQDQRVAEVIIHEIFIKGSLANDVALLILDEPFILEETVQPICLPPQNAIFDHSNCFASGWGKDVFGKQGKYQVILKKVQLPVMPSNDCQQALRTTRLGRRFVLHYSFLCAGGVAGQDTCNGDGGSPLVCPIPGSPKHYYQAGIVAWGIGCGEKGIPGVYVNVAFFRNWIDVQLLERNILLRDYVLPV